MGKTAATSTSNEESKPYTIAANNYSEPKPEKSWYKFGKESDKKAIPSWQDASLSDKERWKQWHKAKDGERAKASSAGVFASFYKAKSGWVWWVGLFGD